MNANTSTRRIVILGGGTGGTLTANRLHRHYKHRDVEITVVDQDDHHIYQPGLLFVPFGLAHTNEIVRPRKAQLHKDINFILQGIDRVELERDTVVLEDGQELPYDVLVVGAQLKSAGTIVWNGPVGVFEFPAFENGTRVIAEAIAQSPAFSIAGGGDTLAAIAKYGIEQQVGYISTGGGAFLEVLEGKTLPGFEILEKRAAAQS